MELRWVEDPVEMNRCGVRPIGRSERPPMPIRVSLEKQCGGGAEVNILEDKAIIAIEAAQIAGEVDAVEEDDRSALVGADGDGQIGSAVQEECSST